MVLFSFFLKLFSAFLFLFNVCEKIMQSEAEKNNRKIKLRSKHLSKNNLANKETIKCTLEFIIFL